MILINEKEYLNLQEQVWRNAETIRCLLSGLKITGTGPTLPPDPEDQDAFLLQQDGKTYLSIYFEADQAWANLGEFPAVGPQGIPGPQGSAATIGAVECSTRTISAGDSASVEVSVDGTNLHFDFEIPQGAIGAQGPRGERGPQGLTGETGPRGPQGETGSSISIAGTLTSSSNLPDPETVPATTAYLVGLTAPYNLYVIVGAAGSRLWKDVGYVTPQNITVDASMSGTSQNPVQNRVVKSYVDAVKTTAEAAYTRSTSNLGRINTIQNIDLPNIYYELADLKEIVFETVAAVAAYVVDPAAFFVTPSYITIDNVAYPVIDDTDAEVAEILGSTIVWNQYENDNAVTVSPDTERFYKWSDKVMGGHKCLIITQPNIAEIQIFDSPTLGSSWADPSGANYLGSIPFSGMAKIVDISSSANYILLRSALNTVSVSAETSWRPNVIDLTNAIPTNTPTSVDDDRVQQLIRYALANPAHAENALLDFKIDNITSRGFNQWDEEWELGRIDDSTGQNTPSSSNIRSKNYMNVTPNTTYSFYNGQYFAGIFQYDANKNYISDSWNGTTLPNCSFIRFFLDASYGTTYNHDICINVSNASLNGQYKPYRESSIDWESIIPTDEDRTARSAGTARDVIYVRDDGNDTFSIVKVKRIKTANLESFSWEYVSGENPYFVASSPVDSFSPVSQSAGDYPYISEAYDPYYTSTGDKTITMNSANVSNSKITIVKDSSHSSVSSLVTALTGKKIAYKLANPEETVLASGLLYDHVSFLIERGGTIAINGGMPDALPGIEIDIPVKRFNE